MNYPSLKVPTNLGQTQNAEQKEQLHKFAQQVDAATKSGYKVKIFGKRNDDGSITLYARTSRIKDLWEGKDRHKTAQEAIGSILGLESGDLVKSGKLSSDALVKLTQQAVEKPVTNESHSIEDLETLQKKCATDFRNAVGILEAMKISSWASPEDIKVAQQTYDSARSTNRQLKNEWLALHRKCGSDQGFDAASNAPDLSEFTIMLKDVISNRGVGKAHEFGLFNSTAVSKDLSFAWDPDQIEQIEQHFAGYLDGVIRQVEIRANGNVANQLGLTPDQLDAVKLYLSRSIPT